MCQKWPSAVEPSSKYYGNSATSSETDHASCTAECGDCIDLDVASSITITWQFADDGIWQNCCQWRRNSCAEYNRQYACKNWRCIVGCWWYGAPGTCGCEWYCKYACEHLTPVRHIGHRFKRWHGNAEPHDQWWPGANNIRCRQPDDQVRWHPYIHGPCTLRNIFRRRAGNSCLLARW
jgi:hypothetical protein